MLGMTFVLHADIALGQRVLDANVELTGPGISRSFFDHTSGASLAPPATVDSANRSLWFIRDAAARLAIRNHLPLAECAHFGQHTTAEALYDTLVARCSSPTIATLGRLLLPYLFPELSAFATVEDLVTHLRTSDARFRAAFPAEFLDRNPTRCSGGSGSGGSGGSGSGGSRGGAVQRGGSGGGQRQQQQQRQSETPSPQKLREWFFQHGASGGSVSCPYVIRTGIEAASLGASECALPGTALAEALHTFTLDSGASRCTVAPPCSCRLLSHQTLLWHHRLGHPSLPRRRGMQSRLLVFGLPRSLPPLPPSLALPCLPCVEGRQRAAPHSSSFPPMSAPLQTLHMDVWHPTRVSGQGREHYFLLVVEDYTRYTTVFPLRRKGEVPDVLIPWIRAVRLELREQFRQDLPVLRLHSVRGGEFSSDLLREFCRGEGILQSFTLPASP
ncbi:unnamed protein product [Closterium sp. NIES-53]